MIVVLWRGELRIQEALSLGERDLDPRRGSILARRGKGGHRREVGMDAWGSEQLRPWLSERERLPVGPLLCVIDGPTSGRPWPAAGVRVEFRSPAARAGVRRRLAPHQLRHAHALELAREGCRSTSSSDNSVTPTWGPPGSTSGASTDHRDRPCEAMLASAGLVL